MFMIDKAEVFNELSKIPIHESEERARIYEGIQAMDGLDIVRCRDCIYSRPAYPILCSNPRGLTSVESKDCFCSYGERKI